MTPDDLIDAGATLDEPRLAEQRPGNCLRLSPTQRSHREDCKMPGLVPTSLVSEYRQTWIDFNAYMPANWMNAPQRRRKAAIRGSLTFARKPGLTISPRTRLRGGWARVTWGTTDELHCEFRSALRALQLACFIPAAEGITADQTMRDAVSERRARGTRQEGNPLERSGVAHHRRSAVIPANPLTADTRGEPMHLLHAFYRCWAAVDGRPV